MGQRLKDKFPFKYGSQEATIQRRLFLYSRHFLKAITKWIRTAAMDLQTLRKWNRNIHRDLGYLCFGLTLIYAISGIAVNHIEDWNPNYNVERYSTNIGGIEHTSPVSETTIKDILRRLGKSESFKNSFQPDPATLKIFIDQNTITVNLVTGEVIEEIFSSRPVIYETNFLHLNHPKRLWTYFADLYAVS